MSQLNQSDHDELVNLRGRVDLHIENYCRDEEERRSQYQSLSEQVALIRHDLNNGLSRRIVDVVKETLHAEAEREAATRAERFRRLGRRRDWISAASAVLSALGTAGATIAVLVAMH